MKMAHTIILACLFISISFLPHPVFERIGFVIMPVLLIGAIVSEWKRPRQVPFIERSDWPVFLFLVSLGAGSVNAIDATLALGWYAMMALVCVTAFYIGKSCGYGNEGFGRVSLIVIACMLIVALIAVAEIVLGKNIIYERFVNNVFYVRYAQNASRPMATLLNPAVAGSYFVGCLPFTFYFLEQKRMAVRTLGFAALCLGVVLIVCSASRGVFLGLSGVLLFYSIMRNKIYAACAVAVAAAIFVAAASFSGHPALRQFGVKKFIFGGYDSMVSNYRIERVEMTARILGDHPFAGIGLGHFRLRFYEYSSSPKGELVPYELMIPDNMYLSIAAEAGVIGICGFLAFCVYVFARALNKIKTDRSRARWMRMIPLAGFTGLLVNMAAYDLFYWYNPFMLFCFLAGLSTAGINRPEE